MIKMPAVLFACCLVAALSALPAPAQEQMPDAARQGAPATVPAPEMKSPRITALTVDWDAARAALAGLEGLDPGGEAQGAAAPHTLAQLNATTAGIFPGIAESGVPVLLPFDSAAFLRDQGQTGAASTEKHDTDKYFFGFHLPTFFHSGPSGYDAAFTVAPQDVSGLNVNASRPTDVQISASSLIYELDGPPLDTGEPVPQLDAQFPGIRRVMLENHLRYTFTRFGVPYVVSILCSDGPRHGRLSCRAADRMAAAFVGALQMVGGAPAKNPLPRAPHVVDRPEQESADFTYYAPGDLLPGTSMKGDGGRADNTVYSAIRFPLAQAPAYINSQSFMNFGNCDLTGRVALGGRGKDAVYRCRVNGLPLLHDESRNYAYPWRDNFCEHRHYQVAQCPAGLGHQGEDIRPSTCTLRSPQAEHCERYQDDVVAVRDGMVLRTPGSEALFLVVDTPSEHIRFRYLHMNPHGLDAAGMVSGRRLAEGEVVGRVGDYQGHEGGTSYHLHFNIQVPTRQGWIYVNPYTTLVAAYERLIGARGRAVGDPAAASFLAPDAMMRAAMSGEPAAASPARDSERERDRKDFASVGGRKACTAHILKGRARSLCGPLVAERRAGERIRIRTVDRRVPRQGDRARHRAGDLRASHERIKARHGRA